MEPHYDRFEKLCGISGKAGNLRGKIIEGGNVFEGPRQNEYPNKPLTQSMTGSIMEAACKSLGYHPFPGPSANMSAAYVNPEGLRWAPANIAGTASVSAARRTPKMSASCRRSWPTRNSS